VDDASKHSHNCYESKMHITVSMKNNYKEDLKLKSPNSKIISLLVSEVILGYEYFCLTQHFLDGPLLATEKSELDRIFPPPYYEWFQYNKDFTKFNNLDKAFSFIDDYMEKNGPFDGLLGFSQGGVLCAAVVCYQMKGVMLRNHPPISFIISISGIKFRDPELSAFLYAPPIKCPSVHITGAKDYGKELCLELIQAFENPL
ncbi:hypothetical protein KI387_026291, partial [Taxus chinensis]